ncbi:hypothetical protein N7489_009525 [Penicillium chrysogenum]|jgi:hypothetical protein|uniref:Transmembrane protein n=1 Tax=Penicillium chrysogenum TaxID=5076 RepID=A0ABQ8WX96_PENCH|nr:uncharacterized protein N7489_009525 [Penicillium chrysogenum]KAJ5228817.1 hypothetical protein N7489_009525 [Penicillium chrysogenum]KAJ5258220.1 hypothetical protein N7524_009776 [Penicillium chrysogenum]KAJ5283548.1 hypothetical protein N7505_001528 [Penicillium chrysogenum]KAJ6168650.1 hypothetical protein N7497_001493 [Penicillium chrysogenum]
MAPQPIPFPGFTPISDRVYLRNGHEKSKPAPADEPTTIIISGWGDGMPKHVTKYSDGYHELYPSARIIVILSRTFQATNQPEEARIQAMMPVVDTVFPTPTGSGNEKERVLVHAMSNTGAIFTASTVIAYQRRHGTDKPFPHQLLVLDSTPGSLDFRSQATRWSRAMAVGTAKFFPWPFVITHGLWYAFLWANYLWQVLRGAVSSGVWADRIINDKACVATDSSRVYLYSKEDEIIGYKDLEENVAHAKTLGYSVDLEMFEGSSHVGHMRLHPEQYWNKISSSWKQAIAEK